LGKGGVASEPRLAFPTAIEGVLHGLGTKVTDRTRRKLLGLGLDVHRLPPAIPAELMPRIFNVMAEDIWPAESADERLRLLGLHFVRGWQQTLLGKAAATFLKIIGPHRTLSRLDRAFRTSDNYTRSSATMVGPTEVLLTISDVDGLPAYWVGVLQGGLEFLSLKGTVTLEGHPRPEAIYRLKWTSI